MSCYPERDAGLRAVGGLRRRLVVRWRSPSASRMEDFAEGVGAEAFDSAVRALLCGTNIKAPVNTRRKWLAISAAGRISERAGGSRPGNSPDDRMVGKGVPKFRRAGFLSSSACGSRQRFTYVGSGIRSKDSRLLLRP